MVDQQPEYTNSGYPAVQAIPQKPKKKPNYLAWGLGLAGAGAGSYLLYKYLKGQQTLQTPSVGQTTLNESINGVMRDTKLSQGQKFEMLRRNPEFMNYMKSEYGLNDALNLERNYQWNGSKFIPWREDRPIVGINQDTGALAPTSTIGNVANSFTGSVGLFGGDYLSGKLINKFEKPINAFLKPVVNTVNANLQRYLPTAAKYIPYAGSTMAKTFAKPALIPMQMLRGGITYAQARGIAQDPWWNEVVDTPGNFWWNPLKYLPESWRKSNAGYGLKTLIPAAADLGSYHPNIAVSMISNMAPTAVLQRTQAITDNMQDKADLSSFNVDAVNNAYKKMQAGGSMDPRQLLKWRSDLADAQSASNMANSSWYGALLKSPIALFSKGSTGIDTALENNSADALLKKMMVMNRMRASQ